MDAQFQNNRYKNLEEYIEYILIPNHIYLKPKRKFSNEKIPCIDIKNILNKKLSEEELKYIFDYLRKSGIKVTGIYTYFQLLNDEKDRKLFSIEEEPEMFRKIKENNDRNIRNLIIAEYVSLAKYLAFVYSIYTDLNIREIESFAYEGLCKAVDNFDYTKEKKFSKFANKYISGFIKNGILGGAKMIIQGKQVNLFYLVNKYVKEVERKYQKSLHNNLDLIDEIVELIIQEKKLNQAQEKVIRNFILNTYPLYLDELNIQVVDDGEINNVYYEDPSPLIEDMLNRLNPKDKFIITNRYGLEGNQPHSLREVGEMLHKSRQRIGEQESEILERLNQVYKNKYAPILDDINFSNYGHLYKEESYYSDEQDSSEYKSSLKH